MQWLVRINIVELLFGLKLWICGFVNEHYTCVHLQVESLNNLLRLYNSCAPLGPTATQQ